MIMQATRRKSIGIRIGDVPVGGGAPISVQSMTTTDTKDTDATLKQIIDLVNAGCEIVRVAVPDEASAEAIHILKKHSPVPIIADIHFDHRLAIRAIEKGADAIRINPGNIGAEWKLREIISCAEQKGIPIRIGINAGSLEREILSKYGKADAKAMVECTLKYINVFERLNFINIKVSLKSASIADTIEANRMIANLIPYPIHLGLTEAGSVISGTVKSALAIGTLLMEGIGDTIRVSLTCDPVQEVRVGRALLQALGLRDGVEIVSCPTCSRKEIPVEEIVEEVEKKAGNINRNIKIAIMGCAVNGPGEARAADIGVYGGRESGVLFFKGKPLDKVNKSDIVDGILRQIKKYISEKD